MRIVRRTIETALLHVFVIELAAIFSLMRRRDERFARAVSDYRAVYQFVVGRSARRLIIDNGQIRTRRGKGSKVDYEIVFFDLLSALRQFSQQPNDVLQLLLQNKIDKSGNNFYLFRFGYLCGLCESRLRASMSRFPRLTGRFSHA